ncbi:MAG: hypothetical protein AAF628_16005 [Planctomycetota bacterium]
MNFGIEIRDAENVILEDIEITGDRKCVGIFIVFSENVKVIRPHIHDVHWSLDTVTRTTREQASGIEVDRSEKIDILEPTIERLGRIVRPPFGVVRKEYWNTDGITFAGCRHFSVSGGKIDQCGECIDITGRDPQEQFVIRGVNVSNADNAGIKIANSARTGIVDSCIAEGCYNGFGVGGPDSVAAGAPIPVDVSDIQFSNCQAINNGVRPTMASALHQIPSAGFVLGFQGFKPEVPRGIVFVDCLAANREGQPPADFGFKGDPGLTFRVSSDPRQNRALNCRVINAIQEVYQISWYSQFEQPGWV